MKNPRVIVALIGVWALFGVTLIRPIPPVRAADLEQVYRANDENHGRQLVAALWRLAARDGGGEIRLRVGDGVDDVLFLRMTSEFKPGRPGDMVDERTLVLRGYTGTAGAVAVLTPSKSAIYFSNESGASHRLVLPAQADKGPPPTTLGASDPQAVLPPIPDDLGLIRAHSLTEAELSEATGSDPGKTATADDPKAKVAGLYASPPGGNSMYISKHLWKFGAIVSGPREPINTVFYNNAIHTTIQRMMYDIAWNLDSCGTTSEAYFADYRHGGDNGWQAQDTQYEYQPNIHSPCFPPLSGERYHIRLYASRTGDTHLPGFRYFQAAGVHHEGFWHDDVDPQRGQDYFFSKFGTHPWVYSISPVQVPHTADECSSCATWRGWVDFYNVSKTGGDPCSGGAKNYRLESNGLYVTWSC